jgi:hypothetical protein
MLVGKLNVVVVFRTEGVKQYTDVQVRMGDVVMATRTLSGRFGQTNALKEFKRFPEKFKPVGCELSTVKAIAA